jgi:hypothetical protein
MKQDAPARHHHTRDGTIRQVVAFVKMRILCSLQ